MSPKTTYIELKCSKESVQGTFMSLKKKSQEEESTVPQMDGKVYTNSTVVLLFNQDLYSQNVQSLRFTVVFVVLVIIELRNFLEYIVNFRRL